MTAVLIKRDSEMPTCFKEPKKGSLGKPITFAVHQDVERMLDNKVTTYKKFHQM